jgi:lipoprotein-releasing system permease protein
MSRLELSIAWRYLRSRKGTRLLSLITVIAIGGVIVGVSALILVVGVMNGLQDDLKDKILVGSPDIRVLTYGDDLTIPKWHPILTRIRSQEGVVAAGPFVLSEALISSGHHYVEATQVEGIEPQAPHVSEPTSIREHIYNHQGDFRFASNDGKGRGAVVGRLLADRLNVTVGDTIRLVAPPPGGKLDAVLGGYTPKLYKFEVTGLFETGMYEYDNQYVFLSLPVSQEFAGLGDAVTGIEVASANRWDARALGQKIETALGFPYRAVDWQEQNRSLFQALKLEKLAMSLILLLVVVVAAFNIVSTLTMVVKDKTREIGILKAMGLPAKSIHRSFFAQGVVIGVVGTTGGLVLGLIGAVLLDKYKLIRLEESVYFIDHMPVHTQPQDVAITIVASLLIAAVATLYPSMQAAKLSPIEAIHHE